jgi:GT2 family glycosyltransferase
LRRTKTIAGKSMAVVPLEAALSLTPTRCSVCVANFNGEHMLADCLDSIFAQTGGIPIEVIVHDDASTDESLSVLARYPQVVVIESVTNVGFCTANNRMVERASGDYVLLLNNDAALFPDALATLFEMMRAQKTPCILTLPQYDWATGNLVDRGCLLDPFYNPVPNLDASRTSVAMTIGACMFLPRALWNELGGFPEWMESIAEDMFVCCLARLRGASVRVTSRSGYRHRQGASFGGNRIDSGRLQTTYRRRYLSERNKTSVMVICTPTWLVWPLLILHIVTLTFEGVLLMLLKRNLRVWREIYRPSLAFVFRENQQLRPRRHKAQSGRRISLHEYLREFTFAPRKLALLLRHGLPRVR